MLGLKILVHLDFFPSRVIRAFKDALHSPFRCRCLKLCLLELLTMLDLALSQIYTRVFRLRKSIDLDSVCVGGSRQYQLSFLL